MTMFSIIKLPQDVTCPVEWMTLNETGHIESCRQDYHLHQLPPLEQSKEVFILLPGQRVRTFLVTLPKVNAKEMKRAMAYAIEDQLAEDINQLYFATGRYDHKQQMIAVINLAYFDQVYQQLKRQAIPVSAILPDFLAIRFKPNTWSLRYDHSHIQWRFAKQLGASIDKTTFANIWPQILQQHANSLPDSITVYSNHMDNERFKETKITIDWQKPKQSLDINELKSPVVNFLQGKYQIKNHLSSYKKRWIGCGWCLIGVLALTLLGRALSLYHLRYEYHLMELQQIQMAQVFNVNLKDPIAIKTQIAKRLLHLRKVKKAEGFIRLLTQNAPLLFQHSAWKLQKLEYQTGQLKITIDAKNTTLPKLKKAFYSKIMPPLSIQFLSQPSLYQITWEYQP